MKDGDYPLTNRPNPWYQMVVERRLDSLIWSQFQYTEENRKEIEDLLGKLQTFMDFYKARIEMCTIAGAGLDWEMVKWYNQRIASCKASLDYYKRNYDVKKGLQNDQPIS